MNLETAKKMLAAAYQDEDSSIAYEEIGVEELDKIESEVEHLGDDIYFLDTALDPDAYDLCTDWADSPCVIGESGGNPTRTVVYVK